MGPMYGTSWGAGLEPTSPNHTFVVDGYQKTVSEGHPWPAEKGTGKDVGGEFYTENRFCQVGKYFSASSHYKYTQTSQYHYNGPVFADDPDWGNRSKISQLSNSELDARGSTAIARTIPTNPSADFSVFLGEMLREGIPSVIGAGLAKSRLKDYRKVGGEYLNVQFGWLPLISSIRELAQSIVNAEALIHQLIRDSGRNVRRQFVFPVETSSWVNETVGDTRTYPWPLLNSIHYNYGSAKRVTVTTHERRLSFSGCYTYHLELGSSTLDRLNRNAQFAKKLLGLRLSPDVFWNLAPWSWLVDWVSNAGDVLHNVSAFQQDGLVLRYGYVMEHTISKHEVSVVGLNMRNSSGSFIPVPPLSMTYGLETKRRRKATPYGFGLELSGFDARQWAILGALGLSRGPSHLF